jgi:hypothetical protein
MNTCGGHLFFPFFWGRRSVGGIFFLNFIIFVQKNKKITKLEKKCVVNRIVQCFNKDFKIHLKVCRAFSLYIYARFVFQFFVIDLSLRKQILAETLSPPNPFPLSLSHPSQGLKSSERYVKGKGRDISWQN